MKYTHDEITEVIEILFNNLDSSNWEDSYHSTVMGSREPNTLYKETVEHKIEYLRDVMNWVLELLEME